ncbi:MAG: hypothetical protein ACRC33_28375 [Gemmataceae bacterium]
MLDATKVAQKFHELLKKEANNTRTVTDLRSEIHKLLRDNGFDTDAKINTVEKKLQEAITPPASVASPGTTGVCYWNDNGTLKCAEVDAATCATYAGSTFFTDKTGCMLVVVSALQQEGVNLV